jgi:membrane-anchored mycosin MYCP
MRRVRLPPRSGAAPVAVLLAVLAVLPGAGPALAGPARVAPERVDSGCPTALPRPRGGPVAGVPWAQRWYEPQRLTGVADGSGVTVAVIDSGVDANHRQLRGRVLPGRDYLTTSGVRDGRTDCVSHGTEVASIIAAGPASGTSFVGLAPGAKILPIRVTEATDAQAGGRAGNGAGLAQAINAAVNAGAQVLNVSMVLYRDDPRVRAAVSNAVRHDALVVAAVGNGHINAPGPDPVPYPAAYPGVLGVGAIDSTGSRLPQSQVGSYVDIAAPGADVTAAAAGDGLLLVSGTSFAAPFVSGTAALIRSRERLPAAEVAARITGAADPAPDSARGEQYGHGILDPYRAVTEVPAARAPVARAAGLPVRVPVAPSRAVSRIGALELAGAALGLAALVLLLASAASHRARRPTGQR